MSHDDMHVIMYKILSYLYECMKGGEEPNRANVENLALGINYSYWCSIVQQLVERGYVKGFIVSHADNEVRVTVANPTVTMDGVEFLMDNSLMAKAKKFLIEAKGFVS